MLGAAGKIPPALPRSAKLSKAMNADQINVYLRVSAFICGQ
jgi:hypothetical protein